MKSQHFNYTINGLRGLCVLLIFVYHIEQSKIIPPVSSLGAFWAGTLYFISSFKYGVEMFFMISGYVIVGSLRKHASMSGFLLDRVLRLYPAWIPPLTLLFIGGVVVQRDFFAHIDAAHWSLYYLADLLFLPPAFLPAPAAHMGAWSLSYEWVFYLLAAGYVILRRSHLGKWGSVFVISTAVLAMINLFPRGMFFLPGVIVALNEERLKCYSRYFRMPSLFLLFFLLLWHATGVDKAEIDIMVIEWAEDKRILYALLAFLCGTYFFKCIVIGNGSLPEKLNSAFFQFFGKISYSFYLWSVIVMYPIKRFAVAHIGPFAGPWGAVAFFALFSFLFSILVSWVSWYLLEVRITKIIRKWLHIEKIPGRTAARSEKL